MTHSISYIHNHIQVLEDTKNEDVFLEASGFSNFYTAQQWLNSYLTKYPHVSFDTLWYISSSSSGATVHINRYVNPY